MLKILIEIVKLFSLDIYCIFPIFSDYSDFLTPFGFNLRAFGIV